MGYSSTEIIALPHPYMCRGIMAKKASTMEQEDTDSKEIIYQVLSQHWAHAEQIRWTLLYNFLVATSIFVLAWAAIFTSDVHNKRVVLIILCAVGFLLSVIWIFISVRASGFVKAYNNSALFLEGRLSQKTKGAFKIAEEYRDNINDVGSLAPSRLVLTLIPSIFAFFYVVLGVASVRLFLVGHYFH